MTATVKAIDSGLDELNWRRITDVLLTALSGEPYPLSQDSISDIENIVEKIEVKMQTGWVGPGYTVWIDEVAELNTVSR